MSDADSQSLPLDGNETTGGGRTEIRWQVVAQTAGLTPATIVAGRLQSEGIPVRAWQEGAGRALGLTVGLLGTGYVAVPDDYADEARRILDDAEPVDEWDEED